MGCHGTTWLLIHALSSEWTPAFAGVASETRRQSHLQIGYVLLSAAVAEVALHQGVQLREDFAVLFESEAIHALLDLVAGAVYAAHRHAPQHKIAFVLDRRKQVSTASDRQCGQDSVHAPVGDAADDRRRRAGDAGVLYQRGDGRSNRREVSHTQLIATVPDPDSRRVMQEKVVGPCGEPGDVLAPHVPIDIVTSRSAPLGSHDDRWTMLLKPESTEGRPWGQPLKKPAGAPLNLG